MPGHGGTRSRPCAAGCRRPGRGGGRRRRIRPAVQGQGASDGGPDSGRVRRLRGSAMIGFSILGPLTAELAGPPRTELEVGPLKQRLLLALLLCRCNGVVLVADMIDTLWWDGPPRTAHKNIQVYITHLRKFLADAGQPGRLRFRPPGYQLRLSAPHLDALRFEELFRAGRLALRDGDARASAAAMRQAIGLWRGQPLEDLQ